MLAGARASSSGTARSGDAPPSSMLMPTPRHPRRSVPPFLDRGGIVNNRLPRRWSAARTARAIATMVEDQHAHRRRRREAVSQATPALVVAVALRPGFPSAARCRHPTRLGSSNGSGPRSR
jgi:hypothetical protein